MQEQYLGWDRMAPAGIERQKMVGKSGGMEGLFTIYQYFSVSKTTIITLSNAELKSGRQAANLA